MTETTAAEVAFNPLEPGYTEWPYDQYTRLRSTDPVHRSPLIQGWVLTRYDDCVNVLRDPTISVEIDLATPTPLLEEQIRRRDERNRGGDTLVLKDDPTHARLRKLLTSPFRPKAVASLRGMIEERVEAVLGDPALLARGEMDVVGDFAYPLPVSIFCEMLGIPQEDQPNFKHWTQCVARSLDPVMSDEEREICMQGTDEMFDYLSGQADLKRREPSDDIMSELVHAEEDGDVLTHEELMAQLITLYVAGHEPTTALIGNGLLALLRHPDQFARLRANPDLLPNTLNELLRYDGPNQFVRRVAIVDMDMGEATVPAGDVIYACLAAANHDPGRWGDDSEAVRIDRQDADRHLQFGSGVHACLGSHLAKLQAEIAFTALLRYLSDIEQAGESVWSERMVLRAVAELPITFTTT